MKKNLYVIPLMLCFLLGFYSNLLAAEPESQEELTEMVDKIFANWDKPDSPGCAVAVIRDGKIIYKNGYGIASLDYNIPITSQTVFDIGSTSKQFTATCIILLAQEGKIDVDDNIRKYIPEMSEYEQPITIRHLIHHTSGVRDYGTLWRLAGVESHNVVTMQDIVDICAAQKNLNFLPGEEYLYSNSGYILLAAIVERVSGKSFGEFAAERIFKPLGMKHTLVYEDRTQVIKNRAVGYSKNDEGIYWIDHYFNFAMGGDGQVLTTVEDLFLWDQNFYNPKVGGQEMLDLLHTQGVLNNGETLPYAFGLSHGTYKGLKTVSHGGAWGGFRAQLIRVPDHEFSVAVLCNLGSMSPSALAHQIIDLYLADFIKTEPKKAKTKTVQPKTDSVNPRVFDRYEGEYNLEVGIMLKITKEQNRLWIQLEGQPKLELHPISETKYFIKEAEAQVTFSKDETGNFSRINILQGGRDIPGKKIETPILNPEEMQEYAGEYYSEELKVTYRLFVENEKLNAQIEKKPPMELEFEKKDTVIGRGVKGIFERNAEGQIIGISLDAGRVKNLKFVKTTK